MDSNLKFLQLILLIHLYLCIRIRNYCQVTAVAVIDTLNFKIQIQNVFILFFVVWSLHAL